MSYPTQIQTIEAHTEGEPLRIVVGGWPEIPGNTILEKRAYAQRHHDTLRRALMLEPRGHADMYGAIPVSPTTDDGDVGVLFLHNEGFSTMCGHGIIALVKAAIEEDLFPIRDVGEIRIDTPSGRVTATPIIEAGRVTAVRFRNVPSFVDREVAVTTSSRDTINATLAFGGAFYAYVDADALSLSLEPGEVRTLIELGTEIKRAVMTTEEISHPSGEADLGFLYGVIFVSEKQKSSEGSHSRNVCIFADGEVDRSPTGTGVSGRAAIHFHRGEIKRGEWIRIESILGTPFEVRVLEVVETHGHAAIIPEVQGRAYLTGKSEFWIDPEDPLKDGFRLGR